MFDDDLPDKHDPLLEESLLIKNRILREKTNVAEGRNIHRKKENVILDGLDDRRDVPNMHKSINRDSRMERTSIDGKSKQNELESLFRNYVPLKNSNVEYDDRSIRREKHTRSKNVDIKDLQSQNQEYLRIQQELDKLKETHRRMFAVKGKIYLAVEKEMAKFKKALKEENEKNLKLKDDEIQKLSAEIEKLKAELKIVIDERNKFRNVYYKLKKKYKSMNNS